MALCPSCEQTFDENRRRPKLLPCGHTACLACLGDVARNVCPTCRKAFRADPDVLVDNLLALKSPADRMWCEDCNAEARTSCFDEHVLFGARRLRGKVAAQLSALRPGRRALLSRLADEVNREMRLLEDEEGLVAVQQDLAALRDMADCAKALHEAAEAEGLLASADTRATPGTVQDGGSSLIRRLVTPRTAGQTASLEEAALVARRQEELAMKEADLIERENALSLREASFVEREDNLALREALVAEREAAAREEESVLSGWGAAIQAEELALVEREAPEATTSSGSRGARMGLARPDGGDHGMDHASTSSSTAPAPALGAEDQQDMRQDEVHADINAQAQAQVQVDATFQDHPPPEAEAEQQVCWMDALPDEVLEHILSLVDVKCGELVKLRRVCRRWREVLGRPAVWRHRTLRWPDWPVSCPFPPLILRLAPCLRELSLDMISGGAFGARSDERKQLMQVVQQGSRCQVRSLVVKCPATIVCGKVLESILHNFEDSLKEVRLQILRNSHKNDTNLILSPVLSLKNLKSLTLDHYRRSDFLPLLQFGGDLSGRMSLEKLVVIGTTIEESLIRKLLDANKDTLLEVKFDSKCKALEDVVKCTRLRRLAVSGFEPGHLPKLSDLKTLEVLGVNLTDGADAELVVGCLQQSPVVPKEVSVCTSSQAREPCEILRRLAAIGDRITSVVVSVKSFRAKRQLLRCVAEMANLEEFGVCDYPAGYWYSGADKLKLAQIAEAWPASATPRLRSLHLHEFAGDDARALAHPFLQHMRASRPFLDVCIGHPHCRKSARKPTSPYLV